jgi:hypothetical protein
VATHQAVIELTMDDWKEAIRVFDIRRSSIPNRERPEQAPGQDGWYGAS